MKNTDNQQWEVEIPSRITPAQLAVSPELFERSIKGKKLKVDHTHGSFLYVEVEGELLGIHQDDLLPDGHDAEAKELALLEVRDKYELDKEE